MLAFAAAAVGATIWVVARRARRASFEEVEVEKREAKAIVEKQPLPALLQDAVLVPSAESGVSEESHAIVKGHMFVVGDSISAKDLANSYKNVGFQATNLGLAIEEINKMRHFEALSEDGDVVKCKIFLGYTSNLISSGLRESLNFLFANKCVDVAVSSAGGVEEDLIKCLAPTFVGSFSNIKGIDLRSRGLNRIGNLLVPNSNYVLFEEWITPVLDDMLDEQNTLNINWTPSKMIRRLGKEINDPSSVLYQAYVNDIPIFCPSLTDGSIGDMIYFHSFRNPGLKLDIAEDVAEMNNHALNEKCTGMIILGGGLIKHHICNANLMRNGADFSVFINTSHEFDGSDAGAKPDEAISWGKIKHTATPVKLTAEATLVVPLILAATFASGDLGDRVRV